jgi:hypothetical protein
MATTVTSIAFIALGVGATMATWMVGYEGNLQRLATELILGVVLGFGAALLNDCVDRRLQPWTIWLTWVTVAYGAFIAYHAVAPDVTTAKMVKGVLGGALYGALLASLMSAFISFLAMRALRRASPTGS